MKTRIGAFLSAKRNFFRNLGERENKWIANPFEEEYFQTASLSISEKKTLT
jgi:hypothetical protein